MTRFSFKKQFGSALLLIAAMQLTVESVKFFNVAWGTGNALGQFSLMWFALFIAFVLFCLAVLLIAGMLIWKPAALAPLAVKTVSLREKLGAVRWLPAILILVFPVYFLQYTAGGVVFQGQFARSMIWLLTATLFAILTTKGDSFIGWNQFLAALLLTASEFMAAVEFMNVTSYPFSQGWSEGNRLWDYSVLFGSDLYLYPRDKEIPVLLDIGRRFIGGLPFLFNGVTIGAARFWISLTFVLPYFLLGLAAFRASAKNKALWLMAALCVFLFLKQGPIHSPLVLSAALTALAWGAPLWSAIPLVIGGGAFAQVSRTTWMFAPAAWIVMLEFVGASFADPKKTKEIWTRSIVLGVAGFFGGFVFPVYILPPVLEFFGFSPLNAAAPIEQSLASNVSVKTVSDLMALQPLLFYRLLPNSTHTTGILIALAMAVLPLLVILVLANKVWQITRLQKLALFLPTFAFFALGLVASAKIGGGGDLHNMDMFLISLMFIGVLAWYNGGQEWLQNSRALPAATKAALALFLILPALTPLRDMYPYHMGEEARRLLLLTDNREEKALGMNPNQETVNIALDTLRGEVALAVPKGDVLFIDQRQLLTFGYIKDVPFVPEYEKKVLMNEALSSNISYFTPFYRELAAKRFALIVSEPLKMPEKGRSYQFGEENDSWVKYVSAPILCYYMPKTTLAEVGVQMLMPRKEPIDCSGLLP